MSKPFHFPTEYAKIGNWPGTVGPAQAQVLLMEALTHKPGAKFVELGFDGGRTTIVLNWVARDLEGLRIFCAPVLSDETGLWFRRAQILHRMNREQVTGHEALRPFTADLVVFNPSVSPLLPVVNDWIMAARPGASIVAIGNSEFSRGDLKEIVKQPGVAVWRKPEDSRAVERAISSVVNEFSENKLVREAKPLDSNQRAKIRSLRRDKERLRDGNGTDPEVHAPVVADEGAKLLPS